MSIEKAKIGFDAWQSLRNERIKKIEDVQNLSNVKYLRGTGDYKIDKEWFYYDEDYMNSGLVYEKHIGKYLSFKYLENILKDGFFFQQPSQWKDDFESRFYEADYSQIVPLEKTDELTPRLYASCFTYGFETEAAWNTYIKLIEKSNDVIRLEINRRKLLFEFNRWAIDNNYMVYVGYVNYKYPLHLLKSIHLSKQRENALWFEDFSLANYLSLLLQKREAYDNEREERVFIIPQDKNNKMNYSYCVKIDISQLVDKIILGPDFLDSERDNIEQLCRKYGLNCKIVKSELNAVKSDSRKPLIIESVSNSNPWSIKNVRR